ncbi:MAG: hypothetical protein RLZZ450_4727 [Pseudomonadota bacterium]|jgi:uncharacterized membrane protein YfcA
MLIVASLLAVLVGVSLGIMGGGGSILTVPILRYVLGMEAHRAIAVSMIVVGTTSLAALVPHARRGRVRWRVGLVFGLAGMVGAYAAGRITHFIPGIVLLSGFALMMFATAFAMLRKQKSVITQRPAVADKSVPLFKVIYQGAAVGAVTGLLGAGGGFVIVPALLLLTKLPIEEAVGTSLLVIAMNTAAGFLGVVGAVPVDFKLALVVSGAAVLGSIAGGAIAGHISPAALKSGFGWFVVAMAFFILAQELPELAHHAPSVLVALLISAAGTTACALLFHHITRRAARIARIPHLARTKSLGGKP